MTAIVRRHSSDDLARLERTIRVHATIQVVGSLVELYTNGDADMEDKAVEAADENRPAYWTTAQAGEADARKLCMMLNSAVATSAALSTLGASRLLPARRDSLLNTLIPLNPKAAAEIRLARGL